MHRPHVSEYAADLYMFRGQIPLARHDTMWRSQCRQNSHLHIDCLPTGCELRKVMLLPRVDVRLGGEFVPPQQIVEEGRITSVDL